LRVVRRRIDVERGIWEWDRGQVFGMLSKEGFGAGVVGEAGEFLEIFFGDQRGDADGVVVDRRGERFLRVGVGGDERGKVFGTEKWLVAEHDDESVNGGCEFEEPGEAGAQGSAHACGPVGVFNDMDGKRFDRWADLLGVCAKDDDERGEIRREDCLGGTDEERLTAIVEKLLRGVRSHARGVAGGEENGADGGHVGIGSEGAE